MSFPICIADAGRVWRWTLVGLFSLSLAGNCADVNEYRTITGEWNNLDHKDYGKVLSPLLRRSGFDPPESVEPRSLGVGQKPLPGARHISQRINYAEKLTGPVAGYEHRPSQRHISDVLTYWGQFLDHDLGLSPMQSVTDWPHRLFTQASGVEYVNITIPAGDLWFGNPKGDRPGAMPLIRSIFTNSGGAREQVNIVTPWIDGSLVYGSHDADASALRAHSKGLMKTSAVEDLTVGGAEFPPLLHEVPGFASSLANPSKVRAPQNLFACGDVRCQENPALLALHIVFLREHNRLARELADKNPKAADMSDEEYDDFIYNEARRWNVAFMNAITYLEYLPNLVGTKIGEHVTPYAGYKPSNKPVSIYTEFSTGAFRYGHSEITDGFLLIDSFMRLHGRGVLPLRDAYWNPGLVYPAQGGIDPFLRGIVLKTQQEVDTIITDEVRNFLFGRINVGAHGDLTAINIARGRDHRIPGLNSVRREWGLAPYATFAAITTDKRVRLALEDLYDHVDDVDLFVGGLAEDHLEDSNLGETFQKIILLQLNMLRDNDRFYFENDPKFTEADRKIVRETSLLAVIQRNTEITDELPPNIWQNVDFNLAVAGGRQIQPGNTPPPEKKKADCDGRDRLLLGGLVGAGGSLIVFTIAILIHRWMSEKNARLAAENIYMQM